MKKLYIVIGIVAILAIVYVSHNKRVSTPTVTPQKQVQTETPATTTTKKAPLTPTTNHDCMISAENFFEKKRAQNVDLLGADWDAYLDTSTGICFVKITNGSIYDTATGEVYHMEGNVFVKTK